MASAVRVELPDIYEANAGQLKRDFEDLSEGIDLLPSPAVERLHPSYEPFVSLLLDAKSPRWEEVEGLLDSTFGSDRGAKEVIPGRWGIGAVREVFGRAIFEVEVAELPQARQWIAWLELSVKYTRKRLLSRQPGTTSHPVDNGASSTGQASVSTDRTISSAPAKSTSPSQLRTNNVLGAEANGREVSSDLSSLSRSQSLSIDPNPDNGFGFFNHREQSVQPPLSPRYDGPRKRSRGDSPSPLPEGKPRRSKSPRKVDKGKQRAVESQSEDEVGGIAENDEAGVEARNEQSQAKKRRTRSSVSASKPINSPYLDEDDDDGEDEDEEESGKESEKEDSDFEGSEGEEADSDDEPVQPVQSRGSSGARRMVIVDEDDVQRDGIEDAGLPSDIMTDSLGGNVATGSSRILSAEEELVRSVFTSIPADVNLSAPPSFHPSQEDCQITFKRAQIGGGPQVMVNAGTSGGRYHRSRNHLCIKTDMNLCGTPNGTKNPLPFAAGQPVVVIARTSKCEEILRGIASKPKLGKTTPFIHVWIKNCYKGMYEVAYDGSKPGKGEILPESTGGGQGAQVHKELLNKIEAHMNDKHSEEVSRSWGFAARDWAGVEAEISTRNPGGKRHVKYIALRCIGWDQESWKQWIAKRDEGGNAVKNGRSKKKVRL